MNALEPRKVEPRFMARNAKVLLQMYLRGWLGWALLFTVVLGSVHALQGVEASAMSRRIAGAAAGLFFVGCLLSYAQRTTREGSFTWSQMLDAVAQSFIDSLWGFRHTWLQVMSVGTFLSVVLPSLITSPPAVGLDPVISGVALAFAIRTTLFFQEAGSLVFLQERLGLTSFHAAGLYSKDWDVNTWTRHVLGAMGWGAAMCFPRVLWGLVPSMLVMPLAWLYFREVYLNETGLPARETARQTSTQAATSGT